MCICYSDWRRTKCGGKCNVIQCDMKPFLPSAWSVATITHDWATSHLCASVKGPSFVRSGALIIEAYKLAFELPIINV